MYTEFIIDNPESNSPFVEFIWSFRNTQAGLFISHANAHYRRNFVTRTLEREDLPSRPSVVVRISLAVHHEWIDRNVLSIDHDVNVVVRDALACCAGDRTMCALLSVVRGGADCADGQGVCYRCGDGNVDTDAGFRPSEGNTAQGQAQDEC